jgi:squalene cyclase
LGLTDNDRLIRNGIEYLLATQNADGSWGDVAAESTYTRYHSTWTAIDGLRDYAWQHEKSSGFERCHAGINFDHLHSDSSLFL